MSLKDQAIDAVINDDTARYEKEIQRAEHAARNYLRDHFNLSSISYPAFDYDIRNDKYPLYVDFLVTIDEVDFLIVTKYWRSKDVFESQYTLLKWHKPDDHDSVVYPSKVTTEGVYIQREKPRRFGRGTKKYWHAVKNLRELGEILIEQGEMNGD